MFHPAEKRPQVAGELETKQTSSNKLNFWYAVKRNVGDYCKKGKKRTFYNSNGSIETWKQ